MTREEAKEFLIDISYKLGNMAVEYLTEKDGKKMREAIKTLEQEPIKALGEELRKVREGIKDGIVLYGYDKAVAICNKYLSETEET